MESSQSFQKGALILDSSGGAGHKYVAKALQQALVDQTMTVDQLSRDDAEKLFPIKDVLLDLVGKKIGGYIAESWNSAQISRNIKRQEKLVAMHHLGDMLFFIPVYFSTYHLLRTMNPLPKKIIITQSTAIPAIIKAARSFNALQRKNKNNSWNDIQIELWLTDLVSEKSTHFLNPVRRLSNKDKRLLTVFLPTAELDDLNYFCSYTGINPQKVRLLQDHELPVDKSYRNPELKNITPGKGLILPLSLTSDDINCMQSISHLQGIINFEQRTYSIRSNDYVYALILGSQPTRVTLKNFAKQMAEIASEEDIPHTVHFFLLCGDKEITKVDLFKEICEEVKILEKQTNYPTQLKLIPLPFQPPPIITKIKARCNRLFSRAGGSSTFEYKVLHLNLGKLQGQLHLVSETDIPYNQLPKDKTERDNLLIKQIPVWEGTNALNMYHTINAEIICPATFKKEIASDFKEATINKIINGEFLKTTTIQLL